ncbi:uncharacterized protein LOC134260867 [Saccostrea cucullata]|uniref:uncharacterized protein LOC134260867 n=1 Tax=Saccostrea cuccullata TaxID=36930 RepID=UPI002ED16448
MAGCCDGYQFSSEINDCIKCTDGFIGPNCVVSCPYPAYGFQCQKECECTEDFCNVTTGCPLDCNEFKGCSTFTTASLSPSDPNTTNTFQSFGKETDIEQKKFEEAKDGFYLPYYGFIAMLGMIPFVGLLPFLLKRLCNKMKSGSPNYQDIQVPVATEQYQRINYRNSLQSQEEINQNNSEINQYDECLFTGVQSTSVEQNVVSAVNYLNG